MLSPSPSLPTTATAVETVVESLLAEILRGHFPSGTRLPAEREMSRLLGASRPTLREALRRLGEWNLVEPRRGSGIVVRPRNQWTIEVLPAFLRYGQPPPGSTTAQLLIDLMSLRRTLLTDIVRLIAARMPIGGTKAARSQIEHAWSARAVPGAFVREDFLVMRAVVEATGFLPAVWMLNRIAGVYLDIASAVTLRVPDDYVASATAYLDALDVGDGDRAATLINAYLLRHDHALFGASP
jgi:GntR family transcriptional regulator, transcriptional repressor for pyruvate dehydrogenase complex